MSTPPDGFVKDPNSSDFWMRPDSDVNDNANWWQQPPPGFEYDPANPGWAFRTGGDNNADWWANWTVKDKPTGLVRGIDVASYQPTDLTVLIAKSEARHVVVRMYQRTIEGANLQTHSRAQVDSARSNGCTVSTPYLWLYANVPVDRQVGEALDLAGQCGISPSLLFLDIEPYTDGSLPNVGEIRGALDSCAARGVRGAIYSGAWVWPRLGNPTFSGVPLWYAVYDGVPALDCQPFGGMTLIGKQFNDKLPDGSPLDVDVFDGSVI